MFRITRFLKSVSILLIITFLNQQFVSANPQIAESMNGVLRPVTTESELNKKQASDIVTEKSLPTTAEFLNDTLALSKAGGEDIAKVVQRLEVKEQKTNENYDYVRYEFEDALEELRPEYASAVIVKNLNEENLKQLLALDFEVGIGALKGEIVLFTSGSKNDIRVTEAVKAILSELSLMSHTHPRSEHEQGPSQLDKEQSTLMREYVLTDQAAYAYSSQSETKTLTHTDYLTDLNLALSEYRKSTPNNVAARALLNQLIVEMDLVKSDSLNLEIFRASEIEFDHEATLADGVVLRFKQGVLTQVVKENLSIKNIISDSSGHLQSAVVTFSSGEELIIENEVLSQIAMPDGRVIEVSDGWFSKITDLNGDVANFTREFNAENLLTSLTVQIGEEPTWGEPEVLMSHVSGPLDINELGSNVGVQSFMQQVQFSEMKTLTQIDMKLIKWLNPVGSLKVVVYQDNGGQPGATLATSLQRNASEFTSYSAYPNYSSLDWESFDFEQVAELQANTKYWISLELADDYASFGDGSNVFRVYHNKGGDTLPGVKSGRKINGSYQDLPSDWDLYFQLHGHVGPDQSPTVLSMNIDADGNVITENSSSVVLSQTAGTMDVNELGSNGGVQSFMQQLNFDTPQTIEQLNFKLTKWFNPVGSVEAVIYEDNGGQPGNLVAKSTPRNASEFNSYSAYPDYNSLDWEGFSFNGVELLANTNYWISVELADDYASFGDGANVFRVYHNKGGDTLPGVKSGRMVNGSYQNLPSDWDLYFQVLSRENTAAPYAIPFNEGYTKTTDALIESTRLGEDLATLLNYAQQYHSEPAPPTISLISTTVTNQAAYTLIYEVDGVEFQESQQLVEGTNTVTVEASNELGRSTSVDFEIVLDTAPPVVEWLSSASVYRTDYRLQYRVDGELIEEDLQLTEGDNVLERQLSDEAGNVTTASYLVNFTPPFSASDAIYDNNGFLTAYHSATTGETLVYEQNEPWTITFKDDQGAVVDQISADIHKGNYSNAIRTNYENGLKAYSVEGKIVAIELADGSWVDDVSFDASGAVERGVIFYVNGRKDIIRYGQLIRRIDTSGKIEDFNFQGQLVREIQSGDIARYRYAVNATGEIYQTERVDSDGSATIYDSFDHLQEINRADGSKEEFQQNVLYRSTRSDGGQYRYMHNTITLSGIEHKIAVLDVGNSVTPENDTPVEIQYQRISIDFNDGTTQDSYQIKRVELFDGTAIAYVDGLPVSVTNALGETIQYDFQEVNSLLTGLKVSRENTDLIYDQNGFLTQVVTEEGTLTRVVEDTNGDGLITNDEVSLLLEEIGGNRLSDFELDANGNILRGIIQTKEGIKQFIENGILTGYETVDGKHYQFGDFQTDGSRDANLVAWNFKDGTRVLYGGGAITEILNPNGSRLHTLGFDAGKNLKTYIEELADGTVKKFEGENLKELITSEGTTIFFDHTGMAKSILLTDGTTQDVVYNRDSNGNLTSVVFQGEHTYRTFSAEGELVNLLTKGLRAEIENSEIKKLFTRFGTIESPSFNSDLELNNEITYVDGTKQIIQNGQLIETVQIDGTQIFYLEGVIDRIRIPIENNEEGYAEYQIIYDLNSNGQLTNARIKLNSEEGAPEFPLIPFLENPENFYNANFGNAIPEYEFETKGNAHVVNTDSAIGDSSLDLSLDGDIIEVPASDDFNFGSDDFTIDFWTKLADINSSAGFMTNGFLGGSGGWTFHYNGSELVFAMDYIDVITASWTPSPNEWTHVALTRSGTTWTVYINGINIKSVARNVSVESSSAPLQIGDARSNSSGSWTSGHRYLNGSLDEIRISSGVRWSSVFNVPTERHEFDVDTILYLPFDEVSEVSSLDLVPEHAKKITQIIASKIFYNSLKDYRIIQSLYSENFMGSAEGAVVIDSRYSLEGTATLTSTDSAIGEKSLDLSSIGDIVSIPVNDDFNFGSRDFTIDFWTKFNNSNSPAGFMTNAPLGGSGGWSFHYNGSELVFAMDYIDVITVPWTATLDQWTHIALTRSGNLWTIYVDGVSVGSVTRNVSIEPSSSALELGDARLNSSGSWTSDHRYLNGLLDEIRISNRVRWNTNFNLPTEQHADDSDTILLLHFDQTISDGNTNQETGKFFISNGDISLDTNDFKIDSGSGKFDGSGDDLQFESHADFDFGSDNWTIDSWINLDASAEHVTLASKYSNAVGWIIVLSPWNNNVVIYSSGYGGITIPANFQPGSWQHVAIVRDGNQIKLYLDGVLQGSGTSDPTYNGADTALRVGQYGNSNWFNGKMDEFRISKGIARWTENFTPQTVRYLRDESTSLLLHFEQNEFDANAEVLDPAIIEETSEGEVVDDKNTLFFAQFSSDPERGKSYSFAHDYLPEWNGLDDVLSSDRNLGFITKHVTLDVHDNLPGRTADLIDMNGDGLIDRVFSDNDPGSTFWWVQLNDGNSFGKAEKWQGLANQFYPDSSVYATQTSLRFFEGRHPVVLGDLLDINGDNLPDRILQDLQGGSQWSVQFNTGHSFEAPVLWGGNPQVTSMWSFQAEYASEVRNDVSNKAIQELIADLVDMDGDGLLDRVVRPYVAPFTHWFFQRNNGSGFDDTMLWEGIDTSFYPSDVSIAASLSWYETSSSNEVADFSGLYDMNGDGKIDRVLLKPSNPNDPNSAQDWYVQMNNGDGFEAAILWDSSVRATQGASNAKYATAISVFQNWNYPRNITTTLKDVTGDGRPDRVSVENSADGVYSTWWVEKNNGTTFEEAVEWTGIYGANANETAISQDAENFRSNNDGGVAGPHGRYPNSVEKVTELIDINGDKILDRLIFQAGSDKYRVQFGTGEGFLPVSELQIEGLVTSTEQIKSSFYDYVHVSLKAAEIISAAQGKVTLTMTPSEDTPDFENQIQSWEIENLTTEWQDFYLPLDRLKADGINFEITFQSVDGVAMNIPISVDNITFTSLRAPATTDWLDRLLTDTAVIEEVHSSQTQTLAEYLGIIDQSGTMSGLSNGFISKLLMAEKRISFDANQQARSFEDSYGAVTEINNGVVSKTTLSDGTLVEFSDFDETNPNQFTQTVTSTDGTVQTQTLSYGRVRTVERAGKSALQYTYEFAPAYSEQAYLQRGISSVVSEGAEITIVRDTNPDFDVYEKYAKIDGRDLLMSTHKANGITTIYEYDERGELLESLIVYKGRIQDRYIHGNSADGYHTMLTEDGTTEAYDDNGNIVYHVTQDGYRYEHSFGTAQKVNIVMEQETVTYQDGSTATFNVPNIVLSECTENCQDIHRVNLSGFQSPTGESAKYQDAKLTQLTTFENISEHAEKIEITFHDFEITDELNVETQKVESQIHLLEAVVRHEDGTVTEFKNGLPFSVTGANGAVINLVPLYLDRALENPDRAELVNGTESAQFHYAQARKLWLEIVSPKFNQFQLAPTIMKQSEYDMQGNAVSRAFAEGTREIYDDGRISSMMDPNGQRMIRYDYDSEGNPIRIEMEASRRHLTSSLLEARANVAVQREQTLAIIAEREQVINHTVEGQYAAVRDRLFVIRQQVLDRRAEIANIPVEGDEARELINQSLNSIDDSLSNINSALENLATQRANALTQLAQQVADVSADFEAQVAGTLTEIAEQEMDSKQAILRQELSTVVHHWYREILGRDPSEAEFDSWATLADLHTGDFDLEALKQSLLGSLEFQNRSTEVQSIKNQVESDLQNYFAMSDAAKQAFAASLGISNDKLISLNQTEISGILSWLLGQSLHFGQSAYLSLEAMLDDANVTYDRVNFATKLILIDILTGTLTPAEKGDLVLSFYAMRLVAESYGLTLNPLALNFEGLQAIFTHECPVASNCDFRLVSHVNKNHYIIITSVVDDIVTYIDPGMGSESAPQIYTLEKSEFLEIWLNSGIAHSGFGSVLTPRGPPAEFVNSQIVDGTPSIRFLEESEQMQIRGAFFGFIKKIFKKVVQIAFYATFGLVYLLAQISDTVKNFLNTLENSINHLIDTVFSLASFDFSAAWGSFKSYLKSSVDLLMQSITIGFNLLAEVLVFVGVPEHIALSIVDGVKIVVGVILLVVPGGQGIGVLLIAGVGASLFVGGVMGIANRYFDMSPTVSRIVNIVASAVAATLGGGFSIGELLTNVAVSAAKEVASVGIMALGNKIGLDPRITGLISMAASAVAGRVIGNSLGVDYQGGLLSKIKTDLIGGAVSYGASLVLQEIDAPPLAQQLIPGLLGTLAGHYASGSGGGGPGAEAVGKSLFGKITENIAKFGGGVVSAVGNAVGNVVSFGAKVVEGIGSVTKAGLANTFEFFSGMFDRETQESLITAGGGSIKNAFLNSDLVDYGDGLYDMTIDFGGKTMTVNYDYNDNELDIISGTKQSVFRNIQMDEAGNFTGYSLFENELAGGIRIRQEMYDDFSSIFVLDAADELLLEISPLDEHIPLSFDADKGVLETGKITWANDDFLSYKDYELVDMHFNPMTQINGDLVGAEGMPAELLNGSTFRGFGLTFDKLSDGEQKILLDMPPVDRPTGYELVTEAIADGWNKIEESLGAVKTQKIIEDIAADIAQFGEEAVPYVEVVSEKQYTIPLPFGTEVVVTLGTAVETYGSKDSRFRYRVHLDKGGFSESLHIEGSAALPAGLAPADPLLAVTSGTDLVPIPNGNVGVLSHNGYMTNHFQTGFEGAINKISMESALNTGANGRAYVSIEMRGTNSQMAADGALLAAGGLAFQALSAVAVPLLGGEAAVASLLTNFGRIKNVLTAAKNGLVLTAA